MIILLHNGKQHYNCNDNSGSYKKKLNVDAVNSITIKLM